jgi:hypothetical protein
VNFLDLDAGKCACPPHLPSTPQGLIATCLRG